MKKNVYIFHKCILFIYELLIFTVKTINTENQGFVFQLWVRDLTSNQVANYMEKCYCSSEWEDKSKKK
jgi:hypothetical protein